MPLRIDTSNPTAHGYALILLSCLLSSAPGSARDAENGSRVELPKPPFVAASYTIVPGTDFEAPVLVGETETKEVRILAGLIRFGNESLSVDVGLDYQYTRYQYIGVDSRNRDLHGLLVPVGFHVPAGRWRFEGYVAPGVMTSSNVMKDLLDDASSDDFAIAGGLEGRSAAGSKTAWLLGVAYDRSFGEPMFYPIAGLVYHPSTDLQIELAFPDSGIRYRASERQNWTARIFPAGNEWHVVSEELNDDFDYSVEAWRAQAWWSYDLWRQMTVDLSLGYEFGRHHDFIDDTGTRIDADVDNQVFFAIGLRLGPAPIPYGQQNLATTVAY